MGLGEEGNVETPLPRRRGQCLEGRRPEWDSEEEEEEEGPSNM